MVETNYSRKVHPMSSTAKWSLNYECLYFASKQKHDHTKKLRQTTSTKE